MRVDVLRAMTLKLLYIVNLLDYGVTLLRGKTNKRISKIVSKIEHIKQI